MIGSVTDDGKIVMAGSGVTRLALVEITGAPSGRR
jgi:hypothetical protein